MLSHVAGAPAAQFDAQVLRAIKQGPIGAAACCKWGFVGPTLCLVSGQMGGSFCGQNEPLVEVLIRPQLDICLAPGSTCDSQEHWALGQTGTVSNSDTL